MLVERRVSEAWRGRRLYKRRRAKRDDSDSDDNSNDNNNNSNSNSNNSNGSSNSNSKSNGSSSSNSGSSGGSSGNSNGNFPGTCPFCVADNDARINYTGAWSLTQDNKDHTLHSTEAGGSLASLNFNGSAIAVFGTIPQNNASVGSPQVTYQIDDEDPVPTAMPFASHPISNQPLFASGQLSTDSQHQITINVTNASTPFTLDYFFIFPASKTSQDSAGSPSSSGSGQSKNSGSGAGAAAPLGSSSKSSSTTSGLDDMRRTIEIVAGTLGSIIFIVVALLILFYVRRRRRQKKTRRFANSCVRDWATSEDAFSKWTSTESILQNSSSVAGRLSRNEKIMQDFGFGKNTLQVPVPALPSLAASTPNKKGARGSAPPAGSFASRPNSSRF